MNHRRFTPILLLALLVACGDDDPRPRDDTADAGTNDAAIASDASVDAGRGDAGAETDDAGGEGGCTHVEAGTWTLSLADDVSIEYEADITPKVEGADLRVLFERRVFGADTGTFTLGEGQDENFGSCSHCVYIAPEAGRGYFASAGTMTLREDPYGRRLDMTLEGVRLVEVTIDGETRMSTPIEGGACVTLEDVTIEGGPYPPPRWTCDDALYDDGEACHCECGAYDPDCDPPVTECPPFDPGCALTEALPIADCAEGFVCAFDPTTGPPGEATTRCTETCDWGAREGCEAGTCVYDFGVGDGDTCWLSDERIDDARLGEACAVSGLQKVCEVRDGFAEGYCGPSYQCRRLCTSNAECTGPGETCRPFILGEEFGYCGPEPVDG